MDYHPVDLDRWLNAGWELLDPPTGPLGSSTIRGLPFAIGSDPARCYLAFGAGEGDGVQIPLGGRRAHSLVFVHRLLQSAVLEGGPIGEVVAEYWLYYSDGTEESRPIRERYEIGLPLAWIRDQPALALPDQQHRVPDRFSGDSTGIARRMTGVQEGGSSFYVWAWLNPWPDRAIETLVISPLRGSFALAGITLGHVSEHPLVPAAARPVRVELLAPGAAGRPFDLACPVPKM